MTAVSKDVILLTTNKGGKMQLVKLESQSGKAVWLDKNKITSIRTEPVPFQDSSGITFNWLIILSSDTISVFTNLDYTEAELSEALGITL